ncbi:MAG TPA: ABC transporter permease [Actinophytocola sp.]|uniref:ABC transporter permease n=1 Tax=Actinophytocola sp. TaxID=1872138 RepID=UPI002DBB0822|nr:ABC transporter permease [Actinophytocola sp.]HEU5473895.1 ABC transporter permease [Actinophytocola sp.]
MGRLSARSVLLGLAAPVSALVFAGLICSLILALTGTSPGSAVEAIVEAAQRPRTTVIAINNATNYYLAAVAVAIGFRMNLFNIGVDGQYRLAAMLAAALAGASFMESLPSFLRVTLTILTAMVVGATWAGIAGFLKVTRGVSEVISTIMLNAIATALVAFLLNPDRMAVLTGNDIHTPEITEGGQVSGIPFPDAPPSATVHGLIVVAILVGFLYWFGLSRTRFGFDLKATGLSESAAVASGVDVKRMVFLSMLLSGAVAGLVGMPELLGGAHSYSLNFPAGVGFIGIAVALLGRNHPIGMAFAALLWGLLDASANGLEGNDVPKEILAIMQGVVVLSVVIAYELVRRYRVRLEQREVGRALGSTKVPEAVGS